MLGRACLGEPLLTWSDRLIAIDRAFDATRALPEAVVPCGKGCSACCTAVFEIHAADVPLLREGLALLDAADRADILARAETVRDRMATEARRLEATEPSFRDWDAVALDGVPARALAELADRVTDACPVLDAAGSCRLHAHRPAICRLQGLPWRDAGSGEALADFCRLVPEQADNPAAVADLAGLDEGRELARRDRSGPSRTTVAGALPPRRLGSKCPR